MAVVWVEGDLGLDGDDRPEGFFGGSDRMTFFLGSLDEGLEKSLFVLVLDAFGGGVGRWYA